jgi:hypothetical protein
MPVITSYSFKLWLSQLRASNKEVTLNNKSLRSEPRRPPTFTFSEDSANKTSDTVDPSMSITYVFQPLKSSTGGVSQQGFEISLDQLCDALQNHSLLQEQSPSNKGSNNQTGQTYYVQLAPDGALSFCQDDSIAQSKDDMEKEDESTSTGSTDMSPASSDDATDMS